MAEYSAYNEHGDDAAPNINVKIESINIYVKHISMPCKILLRLTRLAQIVFVLTNALSIWRLSCSVGKTTSASTCQLLQPQAWSPWACDMRQYIHMLILKDLFER